MLAAEYPNGWNEANSNIANFDTSKDTATTMATDERGYAILVRQQYGTDNLYWCFHNCKISCSISFANRQATRGTLSWEDARYVTFDTSATELVVDLYSKHMFDNKSDYVTQLSTSPGNVGSNYNFNFLLKSIYFIVIFPFLIK